MARGFFDFAKVGEFRVTICVQCYKTIWPNCSFCSDCFSKTAFKKLDHYGTIKEVSISLIDKRKQVYGLIEIGDIKVLGSLYENATPGEKVRMVECGTREDGSFFCRFESILSNDKDQWA